MKVLILYAAYGGGHLSAANAVKEAIENNYRDYEVSMIDFMAYLNKVINSLTIKSYEKMAKNLPWVWGKIYNKSRKGLVAELSNSANRILKIKMHRLIKKENPDIIISTHPFSTQMCASLKKHSKINVKLVNILTDLKYHEQWLVKHKYVDKFFVSNEEMKNDLIKYGVDESKVFATGIPISQRFSKKYEREEVLKEFNLKENLKVILFFAGGKMGLARSNIYSYMEQIARMANHFQIVAISGKNDKVFEKFNEIAENSINKENIKVMEYTTKVPELMSVADLVISKPGGITVSECLASNVPMLIINPIPGQETDNTDFLELNNLAKCVKHNDNLGMIMEELIEDNTLNQLRQNTMKFAKPEAAVNICKEIFK